MATKANNVNNNESANVNNESANVESAKVDNATANTESNNATEQSATDESNESTNNVTNNESATDESANKQHATEPTSEPTAEQIAAARVETKHQKEISDRYAMEAPKEVEKSKFAGAFVLGVYRPIENRKNSDKTFYKIFYNGTIYDGYTATEFCDTVGIERKHRTGNAPKVTTMLDKLEALKAAIEAIDSKESDFVNFAKIVAKKIESEQIESERAVFLAKYAAAVKFFPKLTESDFSDENGADDLALALKLGYKFKDTKATDKATDNKATDNNK